MFFCIIDCVFFQFCLFWCDIANILAYLAILLVLFVFQTAKKMSKLQLFYLNEDQVYSIKESKSPNAG